MTNKNQELELEPTLYLQLLQQYVETGEEPDVLLAQTDALTAYLADTMRNAELKAWVMNDEVAARIFIDTMCQFITLHQQKAAYQQSRSCFERRQLAEATEWSVIKRRDNWQVLVQQINTKYHALGFDQHFYTQQFTQSEGYANDTLWQSMLNDWEACVEAQLKQRQQEFIESRRQLQDKLLHNNLTSATHYVREHQVSHDRFFQSWALMGGRWNALEYERLQQVVNFQRRYPVLLKIVNRMGRTADALGKKNIGHTTGASERMEHASHSDITGISMGRDLNALLPHEWAIYSDPNMEDLFLQRYVTNRLQTFGYESHAMNAARNLHKKPARPLGPMIVCVDLSGSMMGEPCQVALSLMMQLCELCMQKHRRCFLIAFSVAAQPIDVLTDRTQLLQFFNRKASGSTDAHHMMNTMFQLLKSNAQYAGADVLWVTDFRIPLPEREYFIEMERLQQDGTRFYGLQLGIAENRWASHFDELFKIEDVKMLA